MPSKRLNQARWVIWNVILAVVPNYPTDFSKYRTCSCAYACRIESDAGQWAQGNGSVTVIRRRTLEVHSTLNTRNRLPSYTRIPWNSTELITTELDRRYFYICRKGFVSATDKGQEKLLILFVALHYLDLHSAWPRHRFSHPLWKEASEFLTVQPGDTVHRSALWWRWFNQASHCFSHPRSNHA